MTSWSRLELVDILSLLYDMITKSMLKTNKLNLFSYCLNNIKKSIRIIKLLTLFNEEVLNFFI